MSARTEKGQHTLPLYYVQASLLPAFANCLICLSCHLDKVIRAHTAPTSATHHSSLLPVIKLTGAPEFRVRIIIFVETILLQISLIELAFERIAPAHP